MSFATVEKAIAEMKAGRMVILVDDEDRENEGDLCMAAEKVNPEAINFMARYGRGLICLTLDDQFIEKLKLPMMVDNNTSPYGTAFTVSIEARKGVTTGISAADRSHTILTAIADDTEPGDLVRPGHVFPLRAQPGGALVRAGQTEGSVDLSKLAGLKPAAVICEIMNDDGSMARMPQLEEFSKLHKIPIISIADLIRYRIAHESIVTCLASAHVNHARWGDLTVYSYLSAIDGREHLVLAKGDITKVQAPLVRVHTGCIHCDVFGDLFCDCGSTLFASMSAIAEEGCGVLVYLHQQLDLEMPLHEKVECITKKDVESRRFPADDSESVIFRQYGLGAQILHSLGLQSIRLIANHNFKLACIEGFGLSIDEIVSVTDITKNVTVLRPVAN